MVAFNSSRTPCGNISRVIVRLMLCDTSSDKSCKRTVRFKSADLNRTVRLQDLSEEVSQSINRTITREMLPQGVRDELNATITRDRLSTDVRADLNRTIGITNLSSWIDW